MEVAEKLRRWLSSPRHVSSVGSGVADGRGEEAKERKGAATVSLGSGDEDKSVALIKATSTPCPTCGVGETHFHGHACHHVRDGCSGCKVEYCCVCLQSADQNTKLRGRRDICLCPARMGPSVVNWSTWCKEEDILDHLKLEPYPHDDRCGCRICLECRPGRPCGTCHGK